MKHKKSYIIETKDKKGNLDSIGLEISALSKVSARKKVNDLIKREYLTKDRYYLRENKDYVDEQAHKEKWGKIGPPKSAKRKAHMAAIRKN